MSTSHDTDLDSALQRLTAEQVANAPATPPFGDVLLRADATLAVAPDSSDRSRRWMLAAAAGVIALVAGLAVVTRNGAEMDSVASVDNVASTTATADASPEENEARAIAEQAAAEAADRAAEIAQAGGMVPSDAVIGGAGRPLAEVDELRRDEWVLPTAMLAGYDFQYASRDQMFQTVTFGPAFAQEEQIMIGIFGDSFRGGDPTEAVIIGGATWEVQRSNGFWNGTRRVGSVFLSLGGRALDDATATQIIESLRVVTGDEMTVPPLDTPVDQAVVAVFDGAGVTTTMTADAANGWYSTATQSTNGSSSGGGALPFDLADGISQPASGGFEYGDGATSIKVETSGIVRSDATRVEVEFIDGSVVTVEPTDLSGEFGVKFYVIFAEVDLEGKSPERINYPFVESRAFDAAGQLIGSHRPADDVFVSGAAEESAIAEVEESNDPGEGPQPAQETIDTAVPATTTP